jgi:translocator protein
MSLVAPRPARRALAGAALGTVLVAGLGRLATPLTPWYYALKQPAWKPPDWLFGPAWMLIFACATWAAACAWTDAPGAAQRRETLLLFSANGVLNVAWSALFFALQRPDWALAEVLLLWGSIALLIWRTHRWSPRAAAWLWPYLLWVSFAAALNAAVVFFNAPFGRAGSLV